ncbi:hypothetical protein IKS57_04885 [bacterium]|nr:hypothetical protein [bacterium]
MSNVTIEYNNIYLTNNVTSTQFIVEGFEKVPSSSTTEQIISKLDTILKQIIKVSGFTNITAADALNNEDTLNTSVLNVIKQELTDSKQTFNFNDTFTSIQDIVNNLVIHYPTDISLTSDIKAQIPNVIITYYGVELSNTQNSQTFIIEGFETTTAQSIGTTGTPTSRNQQIADLLDSLLNPIIQIN